MHVGGVNGPPSSEILTEVEAGPAVPLEQYWDTEGEDELSEVEGDMWSRFQKLGMERGEETDDQEDLGEESEVDTESDQERSDYGSDYIPTNTKGHRRHPGVSRGRARASNSPATSMRKQGTKGKPEGRKKKGRVLEYEFCPLLHRPPILRLLTRHFCQHPLLPERHGETRTADLIYRDAVHETYLHCKLNHLREVWAYLWTNWYAPGKWKLWVQSAHPHATPQKQKTMVVESMWQNLKHLVLHLHNCPSINFATFTLVTKALLLYKHKLLRIIDSLCEGWAGNLHGEQILIKKAWEALYNQEVKGHYDTNVLQWTCSCGAQKYHSYLLCKPLVQCLPLPEAEWWTTVY